MRQKCDLFFPLFFLEEKKRSRTKREDSSSVFTCVLDWTHSVIHKRGVERVFCPPPGRHHHHQTNKRQRKKMRASVASRFLGFSYGEILGTTVAAVVLLGPKDVPMLAKSLGRMTGKIVGYSHVYREKLEKILDESEVKELHEDLRGTTKALENVVGEIRSGLRSSPSGSIGKKSRGDEDEKEATRRANEGMNMKTNNSSSNNSSRGGSSSYQPRIFDGISAKAVGREFVGDGKKKKSRGAGERGASTVLLRALAEEEVAREALHLSKEGGLVDKKLNERK